MQATMMIMHYSYGWTQSSVRSFKKHLPNEELILFNNNPLPNQRQLSTRGRIKERYWLDLCQKETKWAQSQCPVVEIPRKHNHHLPTHGSCLNFIFKWCKDYDHICLIEPDFLALSDKWFHRLLHKIPDFYVCGIYNSKNVKMQLCPTIWNVSKINKIKSKHNLSFKKDHSRDLNTGQKIISYCDLTGKAAAIKRKGNEFIHQFNGSIQNHKSIYLL